MVFFVVVVAVGECPPLWRGFATRRKKKHNEERDPGYEVADV